jgi:hypothetical protein
MKEQLEQYVTWVKERHQDCLGSESATKANLIAPLLGILGYDMADPRNQDLREQTLLLGRNYAYAVRNQKGRAAFDEGALLNDLNAACGRPGSRITIEDDARAPFERRLKLLDDLLSR